MDKNNEAPLEPAVSNPPIPIILHRKLSKKTLILLVVLASIVLISCAVKLYLSKKIPLPKKVVITADEWKSIKKEAAGSYLYRYFNQQFETENQGSFGQQRSDTEEFFVSTHKYADIPPGSNASEVLGEATDSAAVGRELQSTLTKIRLSGAINNNETGKVDNYELFVTNLAAQDKVNYGGVSDILINGRIGDLQLGDPDFDALHLSIVEPDQSAAYIKASISDIFLIALDRILYGPDPEASVSGVISAQYDDIYPYFDRYVEITGAVEGDDLLPEDLRSYQNEYKEFSRQTFYSTLGDIDNYLTKAESYTDAMAGEPIIRVETKVNNLAFFKQLSNYLSRTEEYASSKKAVYEQYCQNDNLRVQKDCLSYFGYTSESEVNYDLLMAVAPLIKFDKFDIILQPSDKNFSGIDLSISLNKAVFDFLKKILPDDPDGLEDIESLNFQLAFTEMSPQKISSVEKPSSYIHFLPNGSYLTVGEKDGQNINETEKLSEAIFSINHSYVYEIWQEDLANLNQNQVEYCQDKWEPGFCLQVGKDWSESEFSASSDIQLNLVYPSQHQGRSGKSASLSFRNDQEINQGLFCDNKEYENYLEVQTQDNFVYQIRQLPSDPNSSFSKDSLLADVCYQNPNGKYTTASPLAVFIDIYAKGMTFEEISRRVSSILQTIKLANPDQVNLAKDYSQPFERYETFYLGRAEDDPNSCSVGFSRDQNSFSQTYENIKKDFAIDREFNDIVIEENTVFCNWAEITEGQDCLKCVEGKLEWVEMVSCKGLSCNP